MHTVSKGPSFVRADALERTRARVDPAGVLVVDDDDDVRDSLTWLLENEGYHVHWAANGREALDLLDLLALKELPALAIVDLRMPIMDGFQLIEAMRDDQRFASIPIIIISAAAVMDPPPGIPLLKKPVSLEQLLSSIQACARRTTSVSR